MATAKSNTTKKKDEASDSQPVSPRTPQTKPVERTNTTADSGGDHTPRTAGTKQKSSAKKADLTLYRVRHDGHDGPGFSTVAADTPNRAKQLVGDEMVKNDLGHTHGLMEAFEIGDDDVTSQIKPSSEGVIAFDNGRKPR